MAEKTRADWRPPTDTDWRRLRTLLRDVMVHLRTDADMFDKAEQDLRTVGGAAWPTGIGRYPERAERCREMATWVEDEYRALEGGHQRKVPLDDRGMFPGTMAPRRRQWSAGKTSRTASNQEVAQRPRVRAPPEQQNRPGEIRHPGGRMDTTPTPKQEEYAMSGANSTTKRKISSESDRQRLVSDSPAESSSRCCRRVHSRLA